MDVEIYVDGRRIPLNKFVQSVVRDVNVAILSNLKGVEEWSVVEIRIRKSSKNLEI
jgi:hypothetical protein